MTPSRRNKKQAFNLLAFMSSVFKRVGIIIVVFAVGSVGGIFASEILWPSAVEGPLFDGDQLPKEKIEVTKTEKITVRENKALQDAVEETKSSIVGVKGKRNGTGFIITSDGLIVTLSSIAESTSTVVYRGEQLEAGLVKTGKTFTTLRIDKDNLSTRGLAEIEDIRLGERVFLLGKLFNGEPLTVVNHGIIKYFNQQEVHTNISEAEALEGSPLLNIEGDVIGLVAIDRQGKVVGVPLPEIEQLLP